MFKFQIEAFEDMNRDIADIYTKKEVENSMGYDWTSPDVKGQAQELEKRFIELEENEKMKTEEEIEKFNDKLTKAQLKKLEELEKKMYEEEKKWREENLKMDNELTKKELSRSQKEWEKFSLYMRSMYLHKTDEKYRIGNMEFSDLTDYKTLIWNILKYAIRLFNNAGKEHDLEKIAHYAQLAWRKKK